jgi:Haem-binding domain
MEIPVRFFLKLCSVAIGLLALASVFVHPYGSVKSQRSDAPLLTGAEANLEITQIFERSCQNCHSERTEWPWYSYVAPLSWMIEKDVHSGRGQMNLSRWDAYSEDQRVELLTKVGVEVRNHRMPLPKYLNLHPQARLSNDDVAQLYTWVQGERRRLRASIQSKSRALAD